MRHEARRPRYQRTTAVGRALWVDRFRGSGLSRAQFARQNGFSLSSLNRWIGDVRHAAADGPAPLVLSEVKVAASLGWAGWSGEVVSPEGITIRLREPLGVAELAQLLRGGRC